MGQPSVALGFYGAVRACFGDQKWVKNLSGYSSSVETKSPPPGTHSMTGPGANQTNHEAAAAGCSVLPQANPASPG